ncbi:ThiS family protein [Methylorubrum populi]
MQVAVKHSLQLFDPGDASQAEDAALVLPIAEAQAVMGETVAAYLARVAWRFELPTVLTINGEFYGRAEWEARALAANDRVEFISRPLGSGSGGNSTAKSIASVVALVALTALAPYAVAGLGIEALGTAAGALTWGGKIAAAAIVGAAASPVPVWMLPPAPWWRRAIRRARDSLRAIFNVACRFWSPAA